MMLGCQLGSKYLVVPTVDTWGLQMEISTVAELDRQYLVMMLGCQLAQSTWWCRRWNVGLADGDFDGC
jgi:hypothetical protein